MSKVSPQAIKQTFTVPTDMPVTIASRCLIAADVDRTILAQTQSERTHFLQHVAPKLLDSARLGMKLAVVTGNSMSELTERFLKWLIDQLCHSDDLALLSQFHFFCNSGGVYFRFPKNDFEITTLLEPHQEKQRELTQEVLDLLTEVGNDGSRIIRPGFIDAAYLARTQIPVDEAAAIRTVLEGCAERYHADVVKRTTKLSKTYDLRKVSNGDELIKPTVDLRPVNYRVESATLTAIVQLTLKPVLSFRHGRTSENEAQLFEKDLRTELITAIQNELDKTGLGHYEARAGGRSSIDVTLEKLDKAYAMQFIIDHLNLQGQTRRRRRFGANAIYFGDEVIVGGGNDYPVTRIPGLLVFAVNPEKALIPFLSHVFVPSSILEGPEATADVLSELNKVARDSLKALNARGCDADVSAPDLTVIDRFKVKVFGERVQEKIGDLRRNKKISPDDWQVLHAFVTLMHREDWAARHWLAILVDELDAIMTQVTEAPRISLPAIGTSHSDN